jgi:hypothetical protein
VCGVCGIFILTVHTVIVYTGGEVGKTIEKEVDLDLVDPNQVEQEVGTSKLPGM